MSIVFVIRQSHDCRIGEQWYDAWFVQQHRWVWSLLWLHQLPTMPILYCRRGFYPDGWTKSNMWFSFFNRLLLYLPYRANTLSSSTLSFISPSPPSFSCYRHKHGPPLTLEEDVVSFASSHPLRSKRWELDKRVRELPVGSTSFERRIIIITSMVTMVKGYWGSERILWRAEFWSGLLSLSSSYYHYRCFILSFILVQCSYVSRADCNRDDDAIPLNQSYIINNIVSIIASTGGTIVMLSYELLEASYAYLRW
jgi:hypothetical protein